MEESLSGSVWDFTTDDSDRRMLVDDIKGSIAHVGMLGARGIVDPDEAGAIEGALEEILAEAEAGDFAFQPSDEDVHSAVERRLYEVVGDVAGKLHTGRSRNDQVALDLRLYLSRSGRSRATELRGFAASIAGLAAKHAETVIPSYTHLQQAQPTSLGHHLLAYAWMALRSADRFGDAMARLEVSPLGAGASAGSSLPLDPGLVAERLGFESHFDNSLDAVGTRDLVAEYVFVCAQAMVDLSRLSEELILWSTGEFSWVVFEDRVVTGSSALPQKRNVDVAELVRGRSAAVLGDLAAILALQKGLPLAYNRDLQEDKRLVFHADDTLTASIAALAELLSAARFDPPPPSAETVSLDLAERLVARGVPFREAHAIVGRLVADMEKAGAGMDEATLEDLKSVDERFEEDDIDLIDPLASLRGRRSPGSGSPESVRAQVDAVRAIVDGHRVD